MSATENLRNFDLAIRTGNLDALETYLNEIPIGNFPLKQANDLLIRSLNAGITQPGSLHMLIEAWDELTPDDEHYSLPTFARLFYFQQLPDSTLRAVIAAHPEQSVMNVIIDLINGDGSNQNVVALSRALRLYGPQDAEFFRTVLAVARDKQNQRAEEMLILQLQEVSEFAEIPSWIGKNSGSDFETAVSKLPIVEAGSASLTVEEMVELLTAGLNNQGVDFDSIEESRTKLREVLTNSTPEQQMQLLEPVLTQELRQRINLDQPWFSVIGPVNVQAGYDLTINFRCANYGGCRMLLCNCFETGNPYADEDEIEDDALDPDRDWFTGSCDQCHQRIQHRWEALRQPLPNGGWKFNYCSFPCLREAIDTSNPAVKLMIDKMEVQLQKNKILSHQD